MQERKHKDLLTAKTGKLSQASLLWTIGRVLGWPYLALGLIKLLNDILNFAGQLSWHASFLYMSSDQHLLDASSATILISPQMAMPLLMDWSKAVLQNN